MSIKVLKKYNLLIAFLLSILGFGSACSKDKDLSVAYGTPSQRYKVYGKVTSELGSKIPGIKVQMTSEYALTGTDTTLYVRDTSSTITDINGNYYLGLHTYLLYEKLKMEYLDIDGLLNGSYTKKDTIVKFIKPEFENGNGWYQGEVNQELNIKLRE